MDHKTKIYFIENSFDYNGNNLNSEKIGGSEKTLINISNSLSENNNLIIKVFNNTGDPQLINNVYWKNINQIDNKYLSNQLDSAINFWLNKLEEKVAA